MPFITFTPFGRGSTVANKAKVQAGYTAIGGLINTTKLGDDNLAIDAGIPESWFYYLASDDGHTHYDGSLGDAVVGYPQIDIDSPPQLGTGVVKRTEWVITGQSPTKAIFGHTPYMSVGSSGTTVWVPFGAGSPEVSSFMEGTIPSVIVVPRVYYTDGGTHLPIAVTTSIRCYTKDITHVGFTACAEFYNSGSAINMDITYFAVGTAPGYLTHPGGV